MVVLEGKTSHGNQTQFSNPRKFYIRRNGRNKSRKKILLKGGALLLLISVPDLFKAFLFIDAEILSLSLYPNFIC